MKIKQNNNSLPVYMKRDDDNNMIVVGNAYLQRGAPNKPQAGIKQQRTIGLAVREIDEAKRTVRVSFSSEQPVNRFWGSEILCHDDECVDLNRLKEIGVSLFNHDRNVVIGVPQDPNLNSVEKRCYADIYFDDDSDSDKIFQKVKKGILRGVSVGYSVDTWEEVAAGKKSANGRFTGPCYIATKWTPFEVSIVSVPADDSVGVNRENEVNTIVHSTERETNMEKLCRSLGLDYASLTAQGFTDEQIRAMCSALQQRAEADDKDDEAEKKKAAKEATAEEEEKGKKSASEQEKRELVAGESQRAVEIATICRDFDVDAIPYIKNGKSVDDVRAAVLNKVKQERAAVPGGSNDVVILAAEQDKFRAAVTDGLLMRGSIHVEKPSEGANSFRGTSLRDLAVECLGRDGVQNAHRLNNDDLFRRAVTPDSQFVSILDNTVGKSMAIAYKAAPTTYEQWTSKSSNPDFKEATIYQISEAGELLPMTQSGEFKHDEMKDSGVTKKVITYGRSFGLTRQTIINDDIGILTRIPQAYVRSALRGRNALAYKVLCEGKYKGKALFNAQHNNLAATGGVLSTETLAQARKAMRKQKNLRGNETLNISAAFLLVPTELEVAAAQLLRSMSDPSQTNPNVVNVFQNSMNIIVDAELDNYSEKAYYFAANPADCDTIGVTYLNGNEQPQLESQVGFDFLGIKWRIYDDFGVDAFDYRGLFKNPGA